MEELAKVVAINSNEITVLSQVKSSCSSCSQIDSCGSGQVAKAIPHKQLSFTLPYPSHIHSATKAKSTIDIGDSVIISLPEGDVLRTAMQVYLIPLSGLLIGSLLGQFLLGAGLLTHELQALLLGLCGGFLGQRVALYLQNKPGEKVKLQPQIIRLLVQPIEIDVVEKQSNQ